MMLLEFAKKQKAEDSSIKSQFVRGGTLELSGGPAAGQYFVDANGKIENCNNKRGEDVD